MIWPPKGGACDLLQPDFEAGSPAVTEAAREYHFERFSPALLIDDMLFRAGRRESVTRAFVRSARAGTAARLPALPAARAGSGGSGG